MLKHTFYTEQVNTCFRCRGGRVDLKVSSRLRRRQSAVGLAGVTSVVTRAGAGARGEEVVVIEGDVSGLGSGAGGAAGGRGRRRLDVTFAFAQGVLHLILQSVQARAEL